MSRAVGWAVRRSGRGGSYAYRYLNLFIARGQGEPHSVTHGIEDWPDGKRLSFLVCSDDQS